MKKYCIGLLWLASACIISRAQQVRIGFDADDYTSIGVYDAWEDSPFRKGELSGECFVADDPTGSVAKTLHTNGTEGNKVVNFVRSRFGSNQFGARINLREPFPLKPDTQYVHVLMYRPVQGRVMLIGLGKHREEEWKWQDGDAVQFEVLSQNYVNPNRWVDAVFPIKGVTGVDIYSLVVVPECESPHEREEDFNAYIARIEVYATNDECDYPINFDRDIVIQRQDRNFDGVEMSGTTLDLNAGLSAGDKKLYHEDMKKTFFARPGEQTTAVFNFTGTWMNGCVYIDKGQDGSFSWELDDAGRPTESSDLVAFSHIDGKNSNGESVAGNTLNPPAFNMPALPDGFYRIRFKIDWDCADAGGNASETNSIVKNGGGIADARLRVFSGNTVSVNVAETDFGRICSSGGEDLPSQTAYREPLKVRAVADNRYRLEKLDITHGNLEGDEVIHSVPQRLTKTYRLDDFYRGLLTIPADLIDGDVQIQATFIPDDGYVPATSPTLRAEESEGGEVLFFDGSSLAERIEVEADCPETILVYPDAGYKLSGISIHSDEEDINITPAQMSLNKYDIPAAMFHDKTQVVCSATFEPLGKDETGWEKVWKYTWGDEFITLDAAVTQRPDIDKWETPTRYSSAWNRFIADDDNVSYLDDGKYMARCIANPNAGGTEMISGAIQSHNKYSFMYGRVEARIKTTPHYGNFPAFWLMPQNQPDGWPNNGEIDIMEQIDAQNVAFQTVHSNWTYNLGKKYDPTSSSSCSVNMNQWHDYALEWDSNQLRWFVDGKRVFSYAKKTSDADALAKGQWPYDREFYIILNQSVGNGSWASNPDKNFAYNTLFDYVRVYQLFDRNDATGIFTIGNNTAEDNAWYDLQGRRIQEPTRPGVYIHGRKKIYIR